MKRVQPVVVRAAPAVLALVLLAGVVLAAGETVPRSTVGSGGGQVAAGDLELWGVAGQPVAGAVSNGLKLCSGFVPCSPPGPTDVELKSFSAQAEGPAVRVDWETATELNNLGFNLYRATDAQGPSEKLNETLIPTNVPPGSPFGASYTYLDDTAQPGVTYYYWLEDVALNGRTGMHGPVWASLPAVLPHRVYLPLVAR